jgi:hypothetical protein
VLFGRYNNVRDKPNDLISCVVTEPADNGQVLNPSENVLWRILGKWVNFWSWPLLSGIVRGTSNSTICSGHCRKYLWTLYSEVKYISNHFDVGPQLSTFTSLTTCVKRAFQSLSKDTCEVGKPYIINKQMFRVTCSLTSLFFLSFPHHRLYHICCRIPVFPSCFCSTLFNTLYHSTQEVLSAADGVHEAGCKE